MAKNKIGDNMKIDFLEDNNIVYYIDRDKRKNLYIQINKGRVLIKAPLRIADKKILDFVYEKKNWILKNVEKYEESDRRNISYKEGSTIYVLGRPYTLRIKQSDIAKSKTKIDAINKEFIVELPLSISKYDLEDKAKEKIDRYYKNLAKEEVEGAMEDLINRTGLKPESITIKKLSATWGICSSKKKISINQNLMMYSRHAIEYVCLHELCHLRYMNHQAEFWDLVEKYLPDYKIAKKELKE